MYTNILLPVDLDDPHSWTRPLAMAAELAGTFAARLHLINVVPSFGMSLVAQYFTADHEQKMLAVAEQRLAEFRRAHVSDTIEGTNIIAQGSVHREVVTQSISLSCDLIIIGHGTDSIAHFILGSNGTRIVNECNVSVLIVR